MMIKILSKDLNLKAKLVQLVADPINLGNNKCWDGENELNHGCGEVS